MLAGKKKSLLFNGIILFCYTFPFILFLYRIGLNFIYIALFLISLMSLILFLSHIKIGLKAAMPIWILFFYFLISHYFKFYIFVIFGESAAELQMRRLLPFYSSDSDVLMSVYFILSLSFSVFCVIAVVLMKRQSKKLPFLVSYKTSIISGYRMSQFYYIGYLSTLLYLIAAIISWRYQITVMGQIMVALPFRVAGLLFYYRWIAFPIVLLSMIYISIVTENQRIRLFFFLTLILYCIAEIIIRSSRGVVFLAALQIFLLFLFTDAIKRKQILYIVVSLFIGVIFFKIITLYRYSGGNILGYEALLEAKSILGQQVSVAEIILGGVLSVFFRLSGIETLIVMVGKGIEPLILGSFSLHDILAGLGIGKYTSIYIFEIKMVAAHQRGPSFLGFFYMMGGWPFAVLGPSVFLVVIWKVWVRISRIEFYLKPVVQVIFLSYSLLAVMSGRFIYMLKYPLLISIITFWLLKLPRYHNKYPKSYSNLEIKNNVGMHLTQVATRCSVPPYEGRLPTHIDGT